MHPTYMHARVRTATQTFDVYLTAPQQILTLQALVNAGKSGITQYDVYQFTTRLGARVYELRRYHGVAITTLPKMTHGNACYGAYALACRVRIIKVQ